MTAKSLNPDVVLMDIEMPGQDGLEATRCIQQSKPRPVFLLTAHENPELLARFADLVELRRLNEELRTALASVKRLSGLLPISASCKKIRDDKGYWQSVESYLIERTDAQFSHGCCPKCTKKLYPDYIPRT